MTSSMKLLWSVLVAAFAVHVVHALAGGDSIFVEDWVYQLVRTLPAVLVLLHWRRAAAHRRGWLLLGLALLAAAAGDLIWTLLYDHATGEVPTPSVADVPYVVTYPLLAGALWTLVPVPRGPRAGAWVDGLIGGLAAGLVLSELVVEPISLGWSAMSGGAIVTNVSYVVGDGLVLMLLLANLARRGWRVERHHLALGGGVLTLVITDGLYLADAADGTYPLGLTDAGWLVSSMLLALAAFLPEGRPVGAQVDLVRRAAVLPVLGGLLGVVMLMSDALRDANPLSLTLSGLLTLTAFLRFAITGLDHHRLMLLSRRDATTDALTGLGNRRRLLADLDDAEAGPRTLVLLDLDGFKLYNDTFGHPAGDVLLAMIADVLRAETAGLGDAYRLGGDEFCVLVPASAGPADVVGRRMARAVVHDGHGFHVSASHGAVAVPAEAATSVEALALVDRRMYASKHASRGSAGQQSADVLLAILAERTPSLGAHADAVAALAVDAGRHLGLGELELAHLRQAAQLHDVGKMAIPEAVLEKDGALDEAEWSLVRQHPVIGERVLSVAPSLAPVAALVRSSHERWDGGGYPDGLAGEQIPLGARIILACDVYATITTARATGPALTHDEALAELRRCAGTQLDPRVVGAVCAVAISRSGPSRWTSRGPARVR